MRLKPIIFIVVSFACGAGGHAPGQSNGSGTSQVGPGDTSSIEHGKKTPAPDKAHRLLNGALTPETRDRLQKAMDANPTPAPTH